MEPAEPAPLPEPHAVALEPKPPWRLVLALAWPVLLQQWVTLLVSLSDRFLAGYYQSEVAYQAAQTTTYYLSWLISSYIALVSVGSTALVARFVGAGDRDQAIRVTHQSLLLAVGLGLAGAAFGLATVEPLMWLLNLPPDAAGHAANYLRPLYLLLPFQVVEMAGIACLVGAGDTRTGMLVHLGVLVLNLPLAWSFFHGFGPFPKLGFVGIALGTAVCHALGAAVVVTVLARGRAGLRLRPDYFWPDRGLLWRLLRISVPAAANNLSGSLSQLWFLTIVNRLGNTASSAHGIALGWEAMAYYSGAAFGTAAMTLVGQNLGARQPARAARSGWTAFYLGCGVMCTMGAVFFTLAPWMFWLFCPQPEKLSVIEAGVPVLRLVAFAMPWLACCIIFTYALQGAGDTRVPVLFTWVGFLGVRIPLAYLLTGEWVGLGLFGAWLAMFADLVVRGGFFWHRFASGRWQRIQV